MPQSKGRKPKPVSRPGRKPNRGQTRYQPGQLGIPPELIAKMLAGGTPDQVVEMLPPFLWLHHSAGMPGNLCVPAALILQQAYALAGIESVLTPVELIIGHQVKGPMTRYGGGGGVWDGENFDGHCVLWLPGSGRWIDATVTQYPEVRASLPIPVLGRMSSVSFGGTAASREALAEGRLTPGIHMAVPREELLLDYTVVDGDSDAIAAGVHALLPGGAEQIRRAGINLVSAALDWWRKPGIVYRVREAPYPQVHALLDVIGEAPVHYTSDSDWFFETTTGNRARLDEFAAAS